MLVWPAVFHLQLFRDVNFETGDRVEVPFHWLWISEHEDLAARLRPYRLNRQHPARPLKGKTVDGAIVLGPSETDSVTLVPKVRFAWPSSVDAIPADAKPGSSLLELLDCCWVELSRAIRSHANLEITTFSYGIHDVLYNPTGAFVI